MLKAKDKYIPMTAEKLKEIAKQAAKNNKTTCNFSVVEVAKAFGIDSLSGKADEKIAYMQKNWTVVNSETAIKMASESKLVIAGLPSSASTWIKVDNEIITRIKEYITNPAKQKKIDGMLDKKYSLDEICAEVEKLGSVISGETLLYDLFNTEKNGYVAIVWPEKRNGKIVLYDGALNYNSSDKPSAYSEGNITITKIWKTCLIPNVKFYTPKKVGNSISSGDMVLIKGGPTGAFYIGKYEVTNKEYLQYDPGHNGQWSNYNYPVETVSWDDAVNYCKWLSQKTEKNYRLPTDAEWEYACRAGSNCDYYWGNTMDGAYCWYSENSGGSVHPVGQKKPNAWGLYDMSGNVWEWCSNTYNSSNSDRVLRGGSWDYNDYFCRSGVCTHYTSVGRSSSNGFRIVRKK